MQLPLPPSQRWAGRPLSPSVSRPFCGAGAEAVLGGDAPGSGRVQRGAHSRRPRWAVPASCGLSGPDPGQQQKRPAAPTAGSACPHGHPASISGPRRELLARPDGGSLGTVHKVWAGPGKLQRLSPASLTPGQTEPVREQVSGEGSPFLSTALGSGGGGAESGGADGSQGPASPASSPGPARALCVSGPEATNRVVTGQRHRFGQTPIRTPSRHLSPRASPRAGAGGLGARGPCVFVGHRHEASASRGSHGRNVRAPALSPPGLRLRCGRQLPAAASPCPADGAFSRVGLRGIGARRPDLI